MINEFPLFKFEKVENASDLGAFFNNVNQTTFGPAPKIVPFSGTSGSINQTNLSNMLQTVNVTNDFPWTHAPRLVPTAPDPHLNARYDVPSLEMREESIMLNPAFNNLARNLYITVENVEQLRQTYKTLTDQGGVTQFGVNAFLAARAASALGADNSVQLLAAAGGGALGQTEAGQKAINQAMDGVGGLARDLGEKIEGTSRAARGGNVYGTTSDYDQYLMPYQDMYSTELTGWRYKLPYLEDQQRTNSSAYGDQGIIAGGGVDKLRKITTGFSELFSPGVYIDTAKNFSYTGNEKSYTVNFPLLNTTHQADIIRNWQLLFLLTYQNRPNRIDRVQIAPPKIYEAMIPGMWYCRYAYISNLSVDFVGHRRKMTLHVPYERSSSAFKPTGAEQKRSKKNIFDYVVDIFTSPFQQKSDTGVPRDSMLAGRGNYNTSGATFPVTTIIPDAYQVSMTLTELIPESQNTMFAAIRKPNTLTATSADLYSDQNTSRDFQGPVHSRGSVTDKVGGFMEDINRQKSTNRNRTS